MCMDPETTLKAPIYNMFSYQSSPLSINVFSYIESLEKQGAHHVGILKIVPPDEWVPRR